MLTIEKQGSNEYGVWVIGRLDLGGMEIRDLFNTNLKNEVEDTTKPVKVKKVRITRSQKTNQIRFTLVF